MSLLICNAMYITTTAQVRYDCGDRYSYSFTLQIENRKLHGTASVVHIANLAQQVQLRVNRLSFISRSQAIWGDSRRYMSVLASNGFMSCLQPPAPIRHPSIACSGGNRYPALCRIHLLPGISKAMSG